MSLSKIKAYLHRKKQATPCGTAPTADPKTLPSKTRDLWEIAYQNLNSTDHSLVRDFEQIIFNNVRSSHHGERSKRPGPSTQNYESTTPTRRDFQEVVATKLEKFQQKHQQNASSSVQQSIGVIEKMRGFISLAASQEPHAAVAWAAVSLLLPILLQPGKQHENAIKIMDLTTDIIRRYGVKEELLHGRQASASKEDLQLQLRTRILELYISVLRIQMRAVRQFSRSGFHQYARDVFQADDWPTLQEAVKQQDKACQELEDDLSASIQRRELVRTHRQWVLERLDHVEEAAYDAAVEGTESRRSCQEGTRVDLLSTIKSWAKDDSREPIFWLRGMAGTGKTTIAKTIAEELADSQAVASFFFRRNHEQLVSVRKLISTVAYQLAHRDDDFCEGLQESLEKYPSLGRSTTESYKQYQKLIIDPLEKRCRGQGRISTLFIVLDALDECDELENLHSILGMLSNPKHHLPELHVRIFITSREEPLIVQGFAHMPKVLKQELVLHQVRQEQVDHDIEVFLQARLQKIQEMRDLPSQWPSISQVRDIVKQASQLFIFAETVCRFVDVDPRDEDPCGRLEKLCKGAASGATAFSALDKMYRLALVTALRGLSATKRSEVTRIQHSVIGRLILLFDKLSLVELEGLIRIDTSPTQIKVKHIVGPLSSVLNVPTAPQLPVTILHESFRDFLIDKSRSEGEPSLWVSEPKTHRCILDDCLELMSKQLRNNILDLAFPGTETRSIAPTAISEAIPPGLRYACRFWISHAEKAELGIKDWRRVEDFVKQYLLNWLEAMSLLKETSEAIQQLDRLRTNCKQSQVSLQTLKSKDLEDYSEQKYIPPLSSLQEFLKDSWRFTLFFRGIIERAPLQVYYGALRFAPIDSLVRLIFPRESMLKPIMVTQLPINWDSCRQTLEGHTSGVNSVVFSHDGSLVASASSDSTVRLWDAKTGEARHTLEGHTDWVNSVVFSHDGSLVASASRDSTVRLWDAKTGEARHTLEGHTSGVNSVVFSHDGSLVASASRDSTVRLWDAKTGEARHTLEGHTSGVNSVVFSHDGSLVASASRDSTVRLWDAKTGKQLLLRKCSGYDPQIHFDKTGQYFYVEGERVDLAFEQSPSNIDLMASKTKCEYKQKIALDELGEWLLCNEARLIWIPVEFRGICQAQDGVVAIGSRSGRVTFFIEDYHESRFMKDKTPLCDPPQIHGQSASVDNLL